jgi:hypothetical protein
LKVKHGVRNANSHRAVASEAFLIRMDKCRLRHGGLNRASAWRCVEGGPGGGRGGGCSQGGCGSRRAGKAGQIEALTPDGDPLI